MFRRKKLEKRIAANIEAEFAPVIVELEEDHLDYRRRLERKEEAQLALERAQAEVQKLHSERVDLKRHFWETYYEQGESAASEIGLRFKPLQRATKKAEKALKKARASFRKADFDEVSEGFALRAKANIAEDEVSRRIDALKEMIEDLLAEVKHDVSQASQALRDEYEEPRFSSDEERDAHVQKTTEIFNEVAENYTPGSR